MTNSRPKVDPEGYYSLTEAARVLEVDRHTLARYRDEGLIRFRTRKAGRRGVTTGAQIIRCWEGMYL